MKDQEELRMACRDKFAVAAITGLLSNGWPAEKAVDLAFAIADLAMFRRDHPTEMFNGTQF